MELLQLDERPVEYQWKGVTFMIKPHLGAEDKFNIDSAGEMLKDGKIVYNARAFWKAVIQNLVLSWKGVTEKGKEAPFSMEALGRLPAKQGEDLFLDLGVFISKHHKLLGKDEVKEDLKNA